MSAASTRTNSDDIVVFQNPARLGVYGMWGRAREGAVAPPRKGASPLLVVRRPRASRLLNELAVESALTSIDSSDSWRVG
jgi:hypothetical protein